jgi:hypothetical protein
MATPNKAMLFTENTRNDKWTDAPGSLVSARDPWLGRHSASPWLFLIRLRLTARYETRHRTGHGPSGGQIKPFPGEQG